MSFRRVAVLAACLLPADLSAEPAFEGRAALGVTVDAAGTVPYFAPDLTVRLEFGEVLGAEIGAYGAFSESGVPHETYASLTFALGQGRLGVGVTRPAYDLFAPSALGDAFPLAAVARTQSLRSRATLGALRLSEVPVGATLSGEDAALSVNAATANGGPIVVGLGGESALGGLGVCGAVEVTDDAGGEAGARARADYKASGWDLGALAALPAVDFDDGMLEVSAGRAIGRKTRLTAIAAAGRRDSFLGLAAERRIGARGRLRAGVGVDDGDPTADFGLDLRF